MISLLILSKSNEIKKNKKLRTIKNSGQSISEAILGALNFEILAGWCKVFHQSTDHLIIGKFTIPRSVSIDAYLSPLDLSS